MNVNAKIKVVFITLSCLGIQLQAQIQKPPKISQENDIDLAIYTGVIAERYANGSPSLWKTLVNGKAHGLWLEWYPNGTLRYRAYWKNDLGNGKWEYFYPNGKLRFESYYINDLAQGLYLGYHENGQVQSKTTYMDGKKDGVEYNYDVNGILLSRKRYLQGQECIDEPQVFQEGSISKADANEWGINFMPDGLTAYFTRRAVDTGQKRIYVTTKINDKWQEPVIAPFSIDEDEAPFINKDGSKLFFASYKSLPKGSSTEKMDMNIWVMERDKNEWSAPIPLPGLINNTMQSGNIWPANYEAGPMTDANGNLYYWTKGSKNNGTNIYFASINKNGMYNIPKELLPPSSHTNYDTAPQLSPDGHVLFFSSDDRYDGYGAGDIYYSVKKDGKWTAAKNLGPIVNSSQSDGSPSFSPDGKYFYFSSNRGDRYDANGERLWDLYYMESKYLMIEN